MVFVFLPEMMSSTTFDRQQIAQTSEFWIMFGSRFIDKGSTDSEEVYCFGKYDSSTSFPLVQPVRLLCSLTPKMGLKWAYRRRRITQMADLDFLRNYQCKQL